MADSTSARSAVLAQIRKRLTESSIPASTDAELAAEYQRIPRSYSRGAAADADHLLHLFTERLVDYDAEVVRATSDGVAQAIAGLLAAASERRAMVPEGFPSEWLPQGVEILRDQDANGEQLGHEALDGIKTVITTVSAGIAQTGTIILEHSAGQGRRALTLVPDRHICVVRTSQVVETVPEGVQRIRAQATQPITFISGPSATSDIEMTRIRGVHGPRFLGVVLVEQA